MSELAERLEMLAPVLVQRTLARMYANPFWDERFGERGRRFAEQDGHYHITYLAEALRQESSETLIHYARWLQSVLTTRGMCSRHLSDNFQLLAVEIAGQVEAADQAVGYLRDAGAALRYESGVARAVQEVADLLAARAVDILYQQHPEWLAQWGEAGRKRCSDDLLYHFSYLADSLANERPELFTAYVEWIAGFLARHNIPAMQLRESLQLIEQLLSEQLHHKGSAACAVVHSGWQMLEKQP